MLKNPNGKRLRDEYLKFKQVIPAALIPPDLSDIEWFYWDAFWELSTERQVGMSPGPIPGSAIRDYAASDQGYNAACFSQIIRSMDDFYLSWGQEAAPEAS